MLVEKEMVVSVLMRADVAAMRAEMSAKHTEPTDDLWDGWRIVATLEWIYKAEDKLKAALKRFGHHDETCSYQATDTCDCGLYDALGIWQISRMVCVDPATLTPEVAEDA